MTLRMQGIRSHLNSSVALSSAITLLGKASAQVSRLRRKKTLKAVNPEIQDLAEEDIYSRAAPLLFGEGFEKRMKERTESLKILSAAKTSQQLKQYFRGSRPTACKARSLLSLSLHSPNSLLVLILLLLPLCCSLHIITITASIT